MKMFPAAALILLALAGQSRADALKAAAVGCAAPADAERIVALQLRRDKAGADAVARPLLASRACIDLPKGVTVGVDETRAALTCVRLTGDLSCYWIATALVDEHPGEKGGGGKRVGRRH